MSRSIPTVRVDALFLSAFIFLACGKAEKASSADAAAAPAVSEPTPAATGSEPPATGPRLCADFAACRDACAARRPGACLRMQRRAHAGDAGKEAGQVASRMCDAGHAEACHVLSAQLQSDRGRSAKALRRACDLGFGQACVSLAHTTKDQAKAEELRGRAAALLERHCRAEDPYACAAIARDDPSKARWHYDRACDLGDEASCYALVEQLGGKVPKLEVVLLDRACELGEPRACATLGDHYATGTLVTKDDARAQTLKKRGEELTRELEGEKK